MRFVQTHLFLTLLALRLANVCLVQTFTHPDETWQSLEVAHHVVFGYGFLTWEWRHALRGYAHPLLFAAVYKLLAILRLDDTFLLLAAPYVLVALIAASVDYSTFHFARRLAGARVADWTILCSVLSLSMGTDIVRPLVNSAETALTAAAFALWPWNGCSSSSRKSAVLSDRMQSPKSPVRAYANDDLKTLPAALSFAALACIVRPTSGIVWLAACAFLIFRRRPSTNQGMVLWTVQRALRVVKAAMAVGAIALPTMLAIDRFGYRQWVFPPYQFYRFNVQQGLATWFGESHVLYHFYASIPVLFTSMLPFVLHGIYVAYKGRSVSTEPALLAAVVLVLFSLVSHMEYRFVYPLLPIGFMYAGISIDALSGHLPKSLTMDSAKHEKKSTRKSKWLSARAVLIYLFVTNIPGILYVDLVHQRGVVDVFKYLRRNASDSERSVNDIGFLMPCHSTPFYSHLHRDIPMWFLSCEPPLEKSTMDSHYWEANDFEQNPKDFVRDIFSNNHHPEGTERTKRERPSHLVLYGHMADRIRSELNDLGYTEAARFFNTHFSPDSRRSGDVVVFRKQIT